MSALVERALWLLLEDEPPPASLPPLPRFHGGRPRVDLANREALYEAMERD